MTAHLRGLLHLTGLAVLVLVYAPALPVLLACPAGWKRAFVVHWNRVHLRWLALSCDIRARLEGLEHLPPGPVVLLCNHQSAWETFALVALLERPVTFVLKRELLRIPLFGQGLRLIHPIAIDRGAPRAAVRALLKQGTARLADGMSVVVFPEGTRVPPGEGLRAFQSGGALLAAHAEVPVVPVAHDAGRYWPRSGLVRRPGTVRVRLGPALTGEAGAVTGRARAWIAAALGYPAEAAGSKVIAAAARPDARNPPR